MAIHAKINGTGFQIGDTVRVHYRIIEKEVVAGKTKKEKHEEQKERIQVFEGIVISIHGRDENKSFTVRHIGVGNIGVERIFPLQTPWINKITIKKKGTTNRAKLYYLRHKTGKEVSRLGKLVVDTEQVDKKAIPPVEKTSENAQPKTAQPASGQVG